jgi:hypothetical protein
MTLSTRFDSFHVSIDGKDVVYGGRTQDQAKVEIRQPVADMDVMVVLLANVLGKSIAAQPAGDRSHRTEAARVEAAEEGGVILSLVCPHNITRSFHLDRQLAARLAAEMEAVSRRSRLSIVG